MRTEGICTCDNTNFQGVEMPKTALRGSGTILRGKTCGWDKQEKVHGGKCRLHVNCGKDKVYHSILLCVAETNTDVLDIIPVLRPYYGASILTPTVLGRLYPLILTLTLTCLKQSWDQDVSLYQVCCRLAQLFDRL